MERPTQTFKDLGYCSSEKPDIVPPQTHKLLTGYSKTIQKSAS